MNEAEFDQYANDYYNQLQSSIKISGEDPEFYAEYKVRDTYDLCNSMQYYPETILDFGSGIGNSIPWFRKYFPNSKLICSDISAKSIEVSQKRFPGHEEYVKISTQRIDLPNESVDVVFTTCVFHHILSKDHEFWINELRRVLKTGGLLIVFEHNPLNPITISVVKHCPFDANAELILATKMKVLLSKSGFTKSKVIYRIFFPKFLSYFRFLEKYFAFIPMGAQYFVYTIK